GPVRDDAHSRAVCCRRRVARRAVGDRGGRRRGRSRLFHQPGSHQGIAGDIMKKLLALLSALVLFVASPLAQDAKPDAKPADPFGALKYRSIGPAAGGRVSRVAGIAGDPTTYYAATASGGVWKSVNGGIAWLPIFDDQPISSIGSIAVAASDPNVVYVGSG